MGVSCRDPGMLSQVQGKGKLKVSTQVQSVGFPRAWSDERIRQWLKSHDITPLKRPHRTMGRFAWTRILEPDRDRYRYRTGSWGKGIKVRYAIPKGQRSRESLYVGAPASLKYGTLTRRDAQDFLDGLSRSEKRKLDRIFPLDAEWTVEPASEQFPSLPPKRSYKHFWLAVNDIRRGRGSQRNGRRNLELLTVKPGKILPVSNPAFNIREATKQMILLEEHLSVPAKRCPDCIGKHLLAIEALADEAACLDKEGDLGRLPGELGALSRKAQGDLLSGADPCKVAQDIRAVRKKLLKKVFPYKKS